MAIVDLDGAFLRVNRVLATIVGRSQADLLTLRAADITHPDDAQADADLDRRIADGTLPSYELTTRWMHADGSVVDVLLTASLVRTRDGSPRYFVKQVQDVTLQRRAQAALRASEAKYRHIVEQANQGIVILTPDGRVSFANPSLERLLARPPGGLVGVHFREMMRPDHVAIAEEALARREVGEGAAAEYALRAADGREVLVRVTSTTIRGPDGFVGALGLGTDITEIGRAEEARARLKAQLVFAERMASVGVLAAGVGHEINNPLAYVSTNLDLLAEEIRRGEACEERRAAMLEMVDDAREGAARVRRIVRGLRLMARADETRPVPVDVLAVLDLSVDMAIADVRHRVRLVKEYGATPAVAADETRLGQVFLNLVVNAAHAIPEGASDTNEIRIRTRTDPEGHAVVEVRDTGRGIAAEHLSRLFDPFFTTKPPGQGTGLGLAISHEIVTSLGGRIEVESELGRGTTFRVVLPGVVEPHASTAVVAHAAGATSPARARVLIADDDELVGRSMRRVLRDHEVVLVAHGRAALDEILRGERFDVVFCDLMMPEMTGMELHARLESDRPDIAESMVFITGGAYTSSAMAFLEAVANERIEKPFDARDVRALVERRLQRQPTSS